MTMSAIGDSFRWSRQPRRVAVRGRRGKPTRKPRGCQLASAFEVSCALTRRRNKAVAWISSAPKRILSSSPQMELSEMAQAGLGAEVLEDGQDYGPVRPRQ